MSVWPLPKCSYHIVRIILHVFLCWGYYLKCLERGRNSSGTCGAALYLAVLLCALYQPNLNNELLF